MADFNFYLNTQGLRGRTGAKGDAGFAPIIAIGQNTLNTFTLLITTADGTFETPNLRGSIINNAGSGTFLRYDAESDTIYLSDLIQATADTVGGITIATVDEIKEGVGSGVITAENLGDGVFNRLVAGENIKLAFDEATDLVTLSSVDTKYVLPPATVDTIGGVKPDGTTITITEDGTISAVGGSQGTMNYEELTNKPSLYGTEIVGDKKLSDFVKIEAPLKEEMGADYEKDIVIQNGVITNDNLVFQDDWNPYFSSTSSPYPFTLQGAYTINGNEFTPNSYASIPYQLGDIIGFPASTGADIAGGHFDKNGQFIFTHLLRVDGVIENNKNLAILPITSKQAYNNNLKCESDNYMTTSYLSGKSFNDNIAYFQIRIEDNKMVAVFLRSVDGVFKAGIKGTTALLTIIDDTNKLNRILFSGTDLLQNPLNQFKIYRQPNIKLEDVTDQSAFAGLTNMVNWAFPSNETKLSLSVDGQTVVITPDGKLSVNLDEIGNKLNALSSRVTTLEGNATTTETTITNMQGAIEGLTNRITVLETEINGGNA